jgi:oligopeptide/dipeptide ABC transporter ATP-binding protein
MIFQDAGAALNPLYTIGKQIMFVMAFHNIGKNNADRHERALTHLRAAGMPDAQAAFSRYPHELSGGMQQRAMIALALAAEPDLIIADEPTTALDVTIQAQILDLLTQLQRERGISIILITHDLGIVAQTCQQVLVLYAGRVAEYGSVQQVFRNPAHPYTRGLLAALPGTAPAGSELQIIPGMVQSGLDPLPGCAFAPRCAHVQEVCHSRQPALIRLKDDHAAACVLYDGGQQPS